MKEEMETMMMIMNQVMDQEKPVIYLEMKLLIKNLNLQEMN